MGRVICVGAGDPAFDRRTLRSLVTHWPETQCVTLDEDDLAYWRVLRGLWAQAETFALSMNGYSAHVHGEVKHHHAAA